MSEISCARFEALLADALASGTPHPAERLAELMRHAGSCPACAPATDLVEMSAARPGDRDPAPEPPPGYWDAFETRLMDRLARDRRRRAAAGWLVAAAAAAGIAALVLGPRFRSETARSVPTVDPEAGEIQDPFDPFPAAGAIGAFSEGEGGALFPGVDDLSPDELRRLIESLRDEEARLAGGEA